MDCYLTAFCHGSPSVMLKCKLWFIPTKGPGKVTISIAKTKY